MLGNKATGVYPGVYKQRTGSSALAVARYGTGSVGVGFSGIVWDATVAETGYGT